MTQRNRIEDLGVLLEKLSTLTDHEAFNWYTGGRNKDNCEWWESLSEDERLDKIHSIVYQIDDLKSELSECWCIARWGMDDDNKEE